MTSSRFLLSSLLVGLAIVIGGCNRRLLKIRIRPRPQRRRLKQNQPAKPHPTFPPAGRIKRRRCELAVKQRVCPVSGDLLGAMGKPFKTTVKGKTVFLCCEGCEHDLKENPHKYLAKLKDAEEKNNLQQ